jgi:hypothetical protein
MGREKKGECFPKRNMEKDLDQKVWRPTASSHVMAPSGVIQQKDRVLRPTGYRHPEL